MLAPGLRGSPDLRAPPVSLPSCSQRSFAVAVRSRTVRTSVRPPEWQATSDRRGERSYRFAQRGRGAVFDSTRWPQLLLSRCVGAHMPGPVAPVATFRAPEAIAGQLCRLRYAESPLPLRSSSAPCIQAGAGSNNSATLQRQKTTSYYLLTRTRSIAPARLRHGRQHIR